MRSRGVAGARRLQPSGSPGSARRWQLCFGRTPLAAQLRPYATDESDLQALIEGYRSYQRAHHDPLTRCYDDVLATVRRLHERGYPMAVVTSKANDIARRSVAHVGLEPYLPIIVGLESTTRHKPDP